MARQLDPIKKNSPTSSANQPSLPETKMGVPSRSSSLMVMGLIRGSQLEFHFKALFFILK